MVFGLKKGTRRSYVSIIEQMRKVLTIFPTCTAVEDTRGVSRGLSKFSLETCSRPCIFCPVSIMMVVVALSAFLRLISLFSLWVFKGFSLLC